MIRQVEKNINIKISQASIKRAIKKAKEEGVITEKGSIIYEVKDFVIRRIKEEYNIDIDWKKIVLSKK